MTRIVRSALLGVSTLVATLAFDPVEARPGDGAFAAAFGACGQTCVIKFNPGGEERVFIAAARAVRAGAKRVVVIDGPCISACALFADVAREKVCVTSRARFGFHKSTSYQVFAFRSGMQVYRELGQEDPSHSRDIALWVQQRGGFPSQGLRIMSAREATQFWRRCSPRVT
jgi:hypothetical protein